MPKGKLSASSKAQFKAYPSRFEKNKIAKLEKKVKAQPNNAPLVAKLERYLDKGVPYTRDRKSGGHTCKGLHKELGFVKNLPSELMKKSKLEIHWYMGSTFSRGTEPNHGESMRTQLEALGFKWSGYGRRKHKKTTR